ncbi:hypothetical protein IDVR_28710 [Intrasporangium sp. DVR]
MPPCARPLCPPPVPAPCARPLCRPPVPAPCAGPLCRPPVPAPCAGPLCRPPCRPPVPAAPGARPRPGAGDHRTVGSLRSKPGTAWDGPPAAFHTVDDGEETGTPVT